MRLRNLYEALGQEVAIIFGRFNPPHKGHRAAWELASKSPVWFVGTNQSTVGPKDPLPYDVKLQAMKTIWPEIEGHIIAETSWLTMASKMYEKYPNATLLCFTDEDWVTKTIQQYNGKEGAHGYYNFKRIEQKATPRLSSATALRDAVIKGDRDAFTQAAGVDADTDVAGKPFFDLVAEYLLPYQNAPKKVTKKKVAQPVEEDIAFEFDTKLAKILKTRGYEGPLKLEQLGMKWVKAIGNIVDVDDGIMITGKNPNYDGWVAYVYAMGKYAYGQEQGYQTGNAKDVERDTRIIENIEEGIKSKIAGAALAAANLLASPAQASEPVKPITIATVVIDGEVRKYNLGDKFSNAREAEKFITNVLDKQGLSGYTLDIRHGYPKKKDEPVKEAPIEMDPQDPMNPMIYGTGANPGTLKYRMLRASKQIQDLASRAENASAGEWDTITRDFKELSMNIDQIRHGLDELRKLRSKGGVRSRGIEKF